MKRVLLLLLALIFGAIVFADEDLKTTNNPPSFTLFTRDTIHPATLVFSAIDPEGDSVRYIISWDDGYFDTLGFYQNGETVLISHRYSLCGIYIPSAMAIDSKGAATEFYYNEEEAVYGVELPPLFIAGWTFGGKDDDVGNSVQETSDGGYIIAGYTKSFGAGSSDVYLIKTDSSGRLLWQKTFGGRDDDVGNSVQETSDGGFIIAGYTKSLGAGDADVYLIKTDSNGNLLWQKTFGGEEEDVGNSVQEMSDSGFIIVGYTKSFGVINSDVYVIKTDKDGNLLWQKTFGIKPNDTLEAQNGKIVITDSGVYEINTGEFHWRSDDWLKETGNSFTQTSDKSYLIVGTTGIISGSYDGGTQTEIFLIKIDSKGELLWKKIIGPSDWGLTGNSIKQTIKGGYIIVGSYGMREKYGLEGSQSKSIYYVEIDSQGKTIKGNRLLVGDAPLLGDPEWYSEGTSVDVTSDSGYIILGNLCPLITKSRDIHLVKLNKNGKPVWERSFGGSDEDIGNSIYQTKDGGYIITGSTCSFNAGGFDLYLIKTDSMGNPNNHFGPYIVTLFGPHKVHANVLYNFFASPISPQGESVSIRFSWGDGNISEWSPYVASGETVKMSHSWSPPGEYSYYSLVRAQAKNKKGVLSYWSSPLQVWFIKNKAPIPYVLGPTQGLPGVSYTFLVCATDAEGDSVAIKFNWDDGDTTKWSSYVAPGETVNMKHSWQAVGIYRIEVQVKDNKSSEISVIHHEILIGNMSPNLPSYPSGPNLGFAFTSYEFSSSAFDLNEDSVAIRFDWGDGDTSEWSPFVPSGKNVIMSHSWRDFGTYGVKVQAKDKNGAISDWTEEFKIEISPPLKWSFTIEDENIYTFSPAIDTDGTIYFGSSGGLYALKPDGKLKWHYKTKCGVFSSPAIGSDGTVYFGTFDTIIRNNFLYALKPDGKLKWRYQVDGWIVSSPAIGADGTIYFGIADTISRNNYFYALKPDGKLKWRFPVDGLIVSSPAIDTEGTIYFGTMNKIWFNIMNGEEPSQNTHSAVDYFYALNPNGTLKWRYHLNSGIVSSPAIGSDRTIYFGAFDSCLYALNPGGNLKWRYKINGAVLCSPVIGFDGTIYVGTNDSNLYAINPDGKEKWKFETEGEVQISPIIASDGTIYVGTNDGNLYAINPDGTKKWSIDYHIISSSPLIGSDGTIYVCLDSKLYAIYGSAPLANTPWPKFHHDLRNTGRVGGP